MLPATAIAHTVRYTFSGLRPITHGDATWLLRGQYRWKGQSSQVVETRSIGGHRTHLRVTARTGTLPS